MTDIPKLRKPDFDDMGRLDVGLIDAIGITLWFVFVVGFLVFVKWVFS